MIAAERTARDIDLALFADDDIKRLLEMARLRLVQDQFAVGEMRLDATRFQYLRRLDVLLIELAQEVRGDFLPVAALLILLRPLARQFVENPVEFGHQRIKLTEPSKPNSSASRMARRSAIFSRPPCRLSL